MQSDSDTVGVALVTALGMSPLLAERKRQPLDPPLCPAGCLDMADCCPTTVPTRSEQTFRLCGFYKTLPFLLLFLSSFHAGVGMFSSYPTSPWPLPDCTAAHPVFQGGPRTVVPQLELPGHSLHKSVCFSSIPPWLVWEKEQRGHHPSK